MLQIKNYKIKSEVYKSQNTIVYRALRNSDNLPVIIKIFKKEYPSYEEIKGNKYEYEIAEKLSGVKGIARVIELLNYNNSLIMVMEDINGISLNKILERENIDVKLFLKLSIKISEILDRIHKHNIIHKDIKPSNIVINLDTLKTQIIDFSLSSELPKENLEVIHPDHLEGTLAYISPEQTGRTNRSIDYRSDFYSLGVTFYEILTKKLPFYSKDPNELVYFHLTKEPIAPDKINNNIPPVISNIILKLLSKNAEDRYQSAIGIITDLKKCENELLKTKKITNFKLGKGDVFDKFQIPEKIYGREKEEKIILDAFNQASKGKRQVVFVKGKAGIGKTSIINEIHKPIVKHRGYYIKGKFDQYKKNILYSAIIQAFKELIKFILTEKKESLFIWKEKLLKAVGSNGQILINMIPELELIIGKQPKVQILAPNETQNRFNMVLLNFVKVFAQQNNPLILFIDDLQWSDSSSIQLIELLVNDSELNYFMFIGSYRDNEVDKSHLFSSTLLDVKKTDKIIHTINVKALDKTSITEFLADTLYVNKEQVKDLSVLIHKKTLGNPFFIKEFLKTLYSKKLLFFEKKWIWDLKKIKDAGITNNVVALMIEKLESLEDYILDIIKIASCIGLSSNLILLAELNDMTESELFSCIKKAIYYGYIIKVKNHIVFVHDRIREAVYKIILDQERKTIHYNIGLYLFNKYKKTRNSDLIFNIVDQLNLAGDLIKEDQLKILIDLNYKAAVKAKNSAAFLQAIEYFRICSNLLPDDIWHLDYDYALSFFTEWAEVEYISTNVQRANEIVNNIINNAHNTIDKVKAYLVLLRYYNTNMLFKESINLGINMINELGYKFPKLEKINFIKTIFEIIKFNLLINKKKKKLKVKNIIDLVDLPVTKIKEINEIIMILLNIGEACYTNSSDKYPYLIAKMANFALKYGLTYSHFGGITALGGVFAIGLKKYNLAYELGILELKLIEKSESKFLKCFCNFIFSITILHFKKHLKESIHYLSETLKDGLDSGNNEYTSYAINHICMRYFFIENNLEIVKDYFDKFTILQKRLKQKDSFAYFYPVKQSVYALLGLTKNKFMIDGDFFSEDVDLEAIKKSDYSAGLGIYYTFKLILIFILGDYNNCLEYANQGKKYIELNYGQFQSYAFIFFACLTYLLNINNLTKKEKKQALKYVLDNQKNFKILSESCPENYSHMYFLVSAEYLRFQGKDADAMVYYDKAIQSAKDNQFLFLEALANELAARFYLFKKSDRIFQTYMTGACYCYMKWGAKTKLEELEKEFPEIFNYIFELNNKSLDSIRKTIPTITNSDKSLFALKSASLDVSSIMKATQAISSEIKMEGLLKKLMEIVVESAGAQKGIIIINRNEDMLIEAETSNSNKDLILLKSNPVTKSKNLSQAIVNFVLRSKEAIKLDDALNAGFFINDPYVKKNKPKSILCFPIIHQNYLIGILYLENNITTYAFNDQHLEVLKILSSQAAISIYNIYLYENTKEKELLEKEMRLASDIQTSMFPKNLPIIKGFDLYALCKMSKEAGGDLYDVIQITDTSYLFIIGDVSGKGISSALYMSSVINMIRILVESDKSKIEKINNKLFLKDILIRLNKVLKSIMRKDSFVTLFFGLLNVKNNSFVYTSSGHGPIYLFNPKNDKFLALRTKGMACGVLSPEIYNHEIEVKKIIVEKKDFFVFNTDGINEARDKNNVEYFDNYINMIKSIKENDTSFDGINKIFKNYNKFIKNQPQFDDITLMCLKKK